MGPKTQGLGWGPLPLPSQGQTPPTHLFRETGLPAFGAVEAEVGLPRPPAAQERCARPPAPAPRRGPPGLSFPEKCWPASLNAY